MRMLRVDLCEQLEPLKRTKRIEMCSLKPDVLTQLTHSTADHLKSNSTYSQFYQANFLSRWLGNNNSI